MNKNKLFYGLSIAAMLPILAGCSEEQSLPVGEGKIFLSTRVNSDVKVVSRAEAEEELAATTQIWISSDEGVVRKYNGIAEVPTEGVKLLSGNYTIEAWAGKPAYASFEDRWFEGSEQITLNAGDKLAVEVECKIQNICASVSYSETALEAITDYTLTIGTRGGSLTFEGDDTRRGYFMMPEGDSALDWTLTATLKDGGKQFTKSGTITDVKPAHEYRLNVSSGNENEALGGGFIQIEVDETTIDSEDDIVITTPPAITGYVNDALGYGFDITKPIAGPQESIGETSIYVSAASELTSVYLSGMEGIEPFDFVTAKATVLQEVAAQGITNSIENVDGGQMMKIIFSAAYCNSLQNRDEPYVITIKATDKGNKSTTATLTFKVSEAPVLTIEPTDAEISFNSVVLTGQVSKDGVETVGFEYRNAGETEWQYLAGTVAARAGFSKGDSYTATLTNLPWDSSIEYRAVSGSVENPTEYNSSDIVKVALKPTPQLPNGDLEIWSETGTKECLVPVANYSSPDQFWDCGNHGSITVGANVTQFTSEASKVHSGKYSAKLRSQFAGVGALGKFAAGNICVGKYMKTEGTNGVFGFGKPFDFKGLKPKALSLWMHYTPTTVTSDATSSTLKKGDMDKGHIFVALMDAEETYTTKKGNTFTAPYVVATGDPRLFDKHAPQILAYGEVILTEATPGSNLVELVIPLEYYSQTRVPKYIAIICTASKEGDYFTGGEGTTLYVDDFKLVY